MIFKLIVTVLVFYTSCVTGFEYTYDQLAGGWLKYHGGCASWEDAYIQCDTEGAVLASPINSQIREGIKNYLTRISKSRAVIYTGVQANLETSDYYSLEGVDLKKMPVIIESLPVSYSSAQSCVKWKTDKEKVMFNDCQEKIPFVCFKKRKNLVISGCGTLDTEYKYSEQSGSCYKVHTKGLVWSKAYKQCKEEDAYLAISNNQLEKKFLVTLKEKYPVNATSKSLHQQVYMGLRKWNNSGPWMTVKGQTLEDSGFTGWAAGEPNNVDRKEDCATMYEDGTFNDVSCNTTLPYICEKKPEILYS